MPTGIYKRTEEHKKAISKGLNKSSVNELIRNSAKDRWSDPKERKKQSKKNIKYWSDKENRNTQSNRIKITHNKKTTRNKISQSLKKYFSNPVNRVKVSEYTSKALSVPKIRKKMRLSAKKRWSDPKERKRQSEAVKNSHNRPEIKKKLRKGMYKFINKYGTCRIGYNENEILDQLEYEYNSEIKRQYHIVGYYIDGYSEQLNIAFEIDERTHIIGQKPSKDNIRQREIEKELNCQFVRIQDY